MKITASRRDDIIKQRDAYDAEIQKLEDERDAQYDEYKQAFRTSASQLEQIISEMIGPTTLALEIRCESNWDFAKKENTWEVRVTANERKKWDDDVALVWNWDVKFDKEGNPVKDSGSWSGLKATTAEQLDDLQESVRVLKILNDADWETLLTSPMPTTDEFMDKDIYNQIREKRAGREDYETQLLDAQLEELLGGNTAILLYADQYYRGETCILPIKTTDKFVTGYIFPRYRIDGRWENDRRTADQLRESIEPRRTAKTNLVKKDKGEYETIEVPN